MYEHIKYDQELLGLGLEQMYHIETFPTIVAISTPRSGSHDPDWLTTRTERVPTSWSSFLHGKTRTYGDRHGIVPAGRRICRDQQITTGLPSQ